MTQRLRLKPNKLLIIIPTWICTGFLLASYDFFLAKSEMVTLGVEHFSFGKRVVFSMMTGFMGAPFLVFYVNEKYCDKPYGFTVAAVLISFIVIVSVIRLIMGLIEAPAVTGKSLSHPTPRNRFWLLKNKWFEKENVPVLQKKIKNIFVR